MRPQLRATPLAPVVEYFLDSAVEATELDGCSAMTLRLYGEDRELLPIVDQRFGGYKERLRHNMQLVDKADVILAWLPLQRRAGLIHLGMRWVAYEIEQFAETFANWAMSDEIEGGCLLNFRVRQRQKNGITFKRTLRRLYSPRFIRRYVHQHLQEADHMKGLADVVIRRAAGLGCPALEDPEIRMAYRAQAQPRAQLKIEENLRRRRSERKMILRSWRQAMAICGRDTVAAFVRGEEVRLIGAESILAVRKRSDLGGTGLGCLSIALLSREGVCLADLCTFIEKTPTLDQLSGFALWMKAGEDRSVLQSANIIRVEDGQQDHPIMKWARSQTVQDHRLAVLGAEIAQQIGQERAARLLEMLNDGGRVRFVRQLTYEEERARNNVYWERTKGHWMEAMMAAIIGYRNLPLFKMAGVL